MVVAAVSAEIYFQEQFEKGWENRWSYGDKKEYTGVFKHSAGAYGSDEGLQTSTDASFYGIVAKGTKKYDNKDKKLVFSFTVKNEQSLTCGGTYLKLHYASVDPAQYKRDVPYFIMFGPDQCGSDKKIHLIFNYKGQNLLWKKTPRPESDKLTHVYTVIVNPDNTYEVQVDQKKVESGSLDADWDFLKPKQIDDPEDKKPEDWQDEEYIADPEDKKPEDWDSEPETVADAEATQPEDWDEDEDGKWEAPQVPNPKYKGQWKPKQIKNPEYKGQWKPKQIDNPEYIPDAELYHSREALGHVAIDVWQVESGSVFDNIIVADNLEEVNAFVDKTWGAHKDAEKTAHDAAEEKKRAADEEARKKAEAESKQEDDAEDDGAEDKDDL